MRRWWTWLAMTAPLWAGCIFNAGHYTYSDNGTEFESSSATNAIVVTKIGHDLTTWERVTFKAQERGLLAAVNGRPSKTSGQPVSDETFRSLWAGPLHVGDTVRFCAPTAGRVHVYIMDQMMGHPMELAAAAC